ncbi:MAG: hypothetical protein RL092_1507, partial [Bacteroidota bacterium]
MSLLFAYRHIILKYHNGSLRLASGKQQIVSGSGIIFLPLLLYFGVFESLSSLFIVSAMKIVGFLDDILGLSIRTRLILYLLAAAFILYLENWLSTGWSVFLLLSIIYLFWVNAVNFMDGINGMVVIQSLVIVLGLLWTNNIGDSALPTSIVAGLLAFSWFNVRKNAILYLGDAGSIGLGFFLGCLLFRNWHSLNSGHILIFVAVFVVDVSATLLLRLWHRENVFERHQAHLYQRLVYELGWSEILVSILYGLIQAALIIVWQ